jgi:hypothetical protein
MGARQYKTLSELMKEASSKEKEREKEEEPLVYFSDELEKGEEILSDYQKFRLDEQRKIEEAAEQWLTKKKAERRERSNGH